MSKSTNRQKVEVLKGWLQWLLINKTKKVMSNPVVEIPNEISVNETKVLSFGEQLVGIEFNTANEDKVAKVKQLMAEAANILKDSYTNDDSRGPVKSLLFDHAVGELVSAQMAVVKVITFK